MLEQSVNWDYQWGQIIGRAWADDDFKQRLLANPEGAFQEYNLTPPPNLQLRVVEDPAQFPENAPGVLRLVLPEKPSAADLCEDDLFSTGAVGADYCGCRCGACHRCGCGWCGGCHHPPKPDDE